MDRSTNEVLTGKRVAAMGDSGGIGKIERALSRTGVQIIRLDEGSAKSARDFGALVVVGPGPWNETSKRLVMEFLEADKPVAVWGDGVELLLEAGAIKGRSLAVSGEAGERVMEAGGEVVSRQVEVDQYLVSGSGDESSLDIFCKTLTGTMIDWVDERKGDRIGEQSFPASDPPPGPASIS